MWLVRHEGNEADDRLAKEGSEQQFDGPELYFGLLIKESSCAWVDHNKSHVWNWN